MNSNIVEASDNSRLESDFHHAMLALCDERYRALKYNPSRLRSKILELGGLKAALWVINIEGTSDGLRKLWEKGRLDLTVQALVLKPEFASLFSVADLKTARECLWEHGNYKAPWDNVIGQ